MKLLHFRLTPYFPSCTPYNYLRPEHLKPLVYSSSSPASSMSICIGCGIILSISTLSGVHSTPLCTIWKATTSLNMSLISLSCKCQNQLSWISIQHFLMHMADRKAEPLTSIIRAMDIIHSFAMMKSPGIWLKYSFGMEHSIHVPVSLTFFSQSLKNPQRLNYCFVETAALQLLNFINSAKKMAPAM